MKRPATFNMICDECFRPKTKFAGRCLYCRGIKDGKKEIIKKLTQKILDLKENTSSETGAYKYDFCYDDVINLLNQ